MFEKVGMKFTAFNQTWKVTQSKLWDQASFQVSQRLPNIVFGFGSEDGLGQFWAVFMFARLGVNSGSGERQTKHTCNMHLHIVGKKVK